MNQSKSKSRFLASTLHEIRTPIQTIIGTLELLGETNLDKEQLEYVRQIHFSADVLLTLANDVLDFTKIAKKCGFTKLIARIIFKANVTSWLFPMPVDMI